MTAIDIDSLQATNFEFDIEANRRRRAELANDVTELISISKFFLQHYSSNSPEDLPPLPRKIKDSSITKCEKNAANVNKVRAKSSGRIAQTKKSPVANATPTHVKRKQTRMNNGRAHKMRGNGDDIPPLFDKIKLHEYCVDIVDRFFHGPPPNDSDFSESPKEKPNNVKKEQKSVQTTNNNHSHEIVLSKPRKSSKYAMVPSRYMNKTPPKTSTEQAVNRNPSPYRLVSAKSREILEQVARKGTEIRRHSCLTHHRERSIMHREQYSMHEDTNRSQLKFRDIHPTMELVQSDAIFPKRILKQAAESQPPSSAEIKTDEEDIIHINDNDGRSNLSANSIIEVKSPSKNSSDFNQLRNDQPKPELKLQQFPVLSIKPETKCEIENIYEIEIKPNEAKTKDFFPKDKNRVIEIVYGSAEEDNIEKGDFKKADIVADNLKQCNSVKNKYIAPFTDQMRAAEKSIAENVTTDDTHEPSNLSLNLSTTSHLTDDEKYQSDKKHANENHSTEFARGLKTPARNMIDKILEVEGLEEANSEANLQHGAETNRSKNRERTHNFDDLREILRRIRSDKTTMDVVIDSTTPPDLMSPARILIDREVQCENLSISEATSNKHNLQTPKKHSVKNTDLSINSPQNPDSSFMESPKFVKTIDSIRTSARKLDFGMNDSEYRTATREQVEKAAKKFLKSILKNADANMPSDRDDHSSHINLKMGKQKYRILDDQIIQSNFNIKSKHGDCTSSSSSDATALQLQLPHTRLLDDRAKVKCNNWIDQSDSELTANSIEKFINNYNLNDKQLQERVLININDNFCDLSDGEILSEGEFHIP